MRDWRVIRAEIGDRIFYATPTAPDRQPVQWNDRHDHEVRWLHRPEDFVVVKGHSFI